MTLFSSRDERYKIIVGFAGDSGLYLEPIDDQLNGRRTNIDFFATGFYHVVESVLGKGAAMIFEVMINHARVDVSVWLGIGGAKWSDVLLYDLVEVKKKKMEKIIYVFKLDA